MLGFAGPIFFYQASVGNLVGTGIYFVRLS